MNTHADKTQENKSQSVSAANPQMQSGGESTSQFADNRPGNIAQRKLQELTNNSSQAVQLNALQEMANNSPQAKLPDQLQAMADSYSNRQQPVQKQENNTGLPYNLKTGMEKLSGISLHDVNVHRNSAKPAQLQAHAYAQGTDIHLGAGQEKHLPHEAWHVVQQKQGRVKPSMQMRGRININDDAGLEKEADVMGVNALQIGHADQAMIDSAAQTTTAESQENFQSIATAGAGRMSIQRRIDNTLELVASGLSLKVRLAITTYNFDFGDVQPSSVTEQMQALNDIERAVYTWYNAQDTFNFGIDNNPLLETYRMLEAETKREREEAVVRAPSNSAPINKKNLNAEEVRKVDAVWANLINGTGYLKIDGDAAFKQKIQALLVRILDTPAGRQLLQKIASGSGKKREVTIGGGMPPEAKKALLLEESPGESMADPQIYSGGFDKWRKNEIPVKQLTTALTGMVPVNVLDDSEFYFPMTVPADMMQALASDAVGVAVVTDEGSRYFKFGPGAHGAYVALIDSGDDTDNRDAGGKAVHTPAFVTLAHELGHALNQLSGSATLDEDALLAHFAGQPLDQVGTPESPGPVGKQWSNMEEMVTILGIENAIRSAVGLNLRGGHGAAIDPEIVDALDISKKAGPQIIQLAAQLAQKVEHAAQKEALNGMVSELYALHNKQSKGISMTEKVQRIKDYQLFLDDRVKKLLELAETLTKDAKVIWSESNGIDGDFEVKFKRFFPSLGAKLY